MTAPQTAWPSGPTRRDAPVWFARTAHAHHPVLLQLPAASSWLALARDQGCIHRGVAWIPVGEAVVAVPVQEPTEVLADGKRLLIVDAAGARVAVQREAVSWTPSSTDRAGLDTIARRVAGRWQVDGLELPEGAERAPGLQPFATGLGVVWIDLGWVYRLADGRPPQALGPGRRDGRLLAGPCGVVLTGEPTAWTAVAAPGRSLHRLEVPLAPGSLRFDEDGSHLAGLDPEGCVVRVDARTGRVVQRWTEGVPLSARRVARAGASSPAGRALLALPATLEPDGAGARLGGPAGRLWSLPDGGVLDELEEAEAPGGPAGDEAQAPWRALGAERACTVGDQLIAWSDDGLLLRAPTRP